MSNSLTGGLSRIFFNESRHLCIFSNTASCIHKIRIIMRKYLSVINEIIEIILFLMLRFVRRSFTESKENSCVQSQKKLRWSSYVVVSWYFFSWKKKTSGKKSLCPVSLELFYSSQASSFLRCMYRYPNKNISCPELLKCQTGRKLAIHKNPIVYPWSSCRFVHMNKCESGWSFYLGLSMKCKQVELFHIKFIKSQFHWQCDLKCDRLVNLLLIYISVCK